MPNTVTKEITTDELKPGDLIVRADSKSVEGHTVQGTRMNRTRMVVSFAPDIQKPFSRSATFTVQREEPTDAEKAQEAYDHEVFLMRYSLDRLNSEKHAQVVEKAASEGTDAYLRWSDIHELIESQEQARYYRYIQEKVEFYRMHGADELTALKGAFGLILAMAEDRYPRDPMSQSTAVISNIMDDVRHYVEDKIVANVTREGRCTREELRVSLAACVAAVSENN